MAFPCCSTALKFITIIFYLIGFFENVNSRVMIQNITYYIQDGIRHFGKKKCFANFKLIGPIKFTSMVL